MFGINLWKRIGYIRRLECTWPAPFAGKPSSNGFNYHCSMISLSKNRSVPVTGSTKRSPWASSFKGRS
jgi:hypothetical protein